MKGVCVDCDYEAPNKSRLKLHVQLNHTFYCSVCEHNIFGNKHFEEHNVMIHENSEKAVTNEEFENLEANEKYYSTRLSYGDFMMSPNSPRRQDWVL